MEIHKCDRCSEEEYIPTNQKIQYFIPLNDYVPGSRDFNKDIKIQKESWELCNDCFQNTRFMIYNSYEEDDYSDEGVHYKGRTTPLIRQKPENKKDLGVILIDPNDGKEVSLSKKAAESLIKYLNVSWGTNRERNTYH